MKKKPTITAFGEALWDLMPDGPVLGGANFNFVLRLKTLHADAELISRLGDDDLGNTAAEKIAALDFDFQYIQRDGTKPTGTVPVSFDEDKNPSYVITPDVAYDYIEKTAALERRIAVSDCLCFGALIQRSSVSRNTLYSLIESFTGRFLLFDINLRKDCYSTETVQESLRKCHILKLNEDELAELRGMLGLSGSSIAESAMSCLEKYGLKYCLVTLGEKGVYALSETGESVYEPGFKVDFVDPVGAGDACTAGFIYSLLTDSTLKDACRFANALGAAVTETSGAAALVPESEIEKKLKEGVCTAPHEEFV